MTDIMIDLETVDTKESAMILSIGAVPFNPDEPAMDAESFDMYLSDSFLMSLDLSTQAGRTVSNDTIMWWMNQDARAQAAMDGTIQLYDALVALIDFIKDYKGENILANSPSFDLRILEHAFKQYGLTTPWVFYNEQDVRTLSKCVFPEGKPSAPFAGQMIAHRADHDCVYQCWLVQEAMDVIQKGRGE